MQIILWPILAAALSGAVQEPPTVGVYLQRAFSGVSTNLLAVAETMPASDYGFRPAGSSADVRTFGQLIGHTAVSYTATCASIRGAADPFAGTDGQSVSGKEELVAMLKTAIAFCGEGLAALRDETALQVQTWKTPNGTERRGAAASAWIFHIAHTNEHYGNLVTYLRARGLKPPDAPAQVFWRW